MVKKTNSGIYTDRRSRKDRRRVHDLDYFLEGGVERRAWKERRSLVERRSGWFRVSKWASVSGGVSERGTGIKRPFL
jgi:hypothetical protein